MRTKSMILAALVALTPLFAAPVYADVQEKQATFYGDASFTAASTASIFFRPNGSLAVPVTYTGSTIVPKGVFIESISVYGVSDTASVALAVISTDVTYTATTTGSTNEKLIQNILLETTFTTNSSLHNPRTYNFTHSGASKGLWCPNWPAIRVDSGTNTPVVKIQWTKAVVNKIQSFQ